MGAKAWDGLPAELVIHSSLRKVGMASYLYLRAVICSPFSVMLDVRALSSSACVCGAEYHVCIRYVLLCR